MKAFGCKQDGEPETALLSELTLVADPSTLRDLAAFLYRCADNIEEQHEEWEHDEFECLDTVYPQLIVFNPALVSEQTEQD